MLLNKIILRCFLFVLKITVGALLPLVFSSDMIISFLWDVTYVMSMYFEA